MQNFVLPHPALAGGLLDWPQPGSSWRRCPLLVAACGSWLSTSKAASPTRLDLLYLVLTLSAAVSLSPVTSAPSPPPLLVIHIADSRRLGPLQLPPPLFNGCCALSLAVLTSRLPASQTLSPIMKVTFKVRHHLRLLPSPASSRRRPRSSICCRPPAASSICSFAHPLSRISSSKSSRSTSNPPSWYAHPAPSSPTTRANSPN